MTAERRKHVLVFIGGGLGPVAGGVGTLMRYLIAEWSRDPAGLPVRVIDTRGSGALASAALAFASGLAALAWGRLGGGAACAHIHMTTRGSALRKALLCALARSIGLPVVLHLHGADFFDFHAGLPSPARRLLGWCIEAASSVVVIGTQWRDMLVDRVGVSPDRVRVVRNGVPAAPRAVPASDTPRILFLGRLGTRKGVPELVDALAGATLRARAWDATIAGDGDAAWLEHLVARAGLAARIDRPGWLDEARVAQALHTADILVLPSHHEVMPMAILEAMARGVAIVATPVGAIPETLSDGVNARLVAPGDAPALAAALAGLIDDPALRRRLGAQGLRDFEAGLHIGVPAASLQAIYRRAAGHG